MYAQKLYKNAFLKKFFQKKRFNIAFWRTFMIIRERVCTTQPWLGYYRWKQTKRQKNSPKTCPSM